MMGRCGTLIVLMLLAFHAGAGEARAQLPPAQAGTVKLADEATGWLAALIRINTTNPPGNEAAAARYLAEILEREGIRAEVLEVTPGRAALVARLQASPVPDPSRALLLAGHLDVVGVQRDKWTVDPFGGVIKNGFLYGRGALDNKSLVVANLATLVALKRNAVRLGRDVIFLATADEEQGGDASIKVLIGKYWDKFAAGYALNEGGHVVLKGGRVEYVGVQASEKVAHNVTVIATGQAGHASIPRKDNAVVHLAAAVAKIGAYEAPVQPNAVTRRYFEQLSRIEDPELGKWMRALDTPERMQLATHRLAETNPAWGSMLRDSIVPTILQAGVRANVIPSEARATLNIRLLPGNSLDPLLAELRKTVNDPQIRFETQPDSGEPAPPSSLESELYQTIERVSPQVFPGTPVLPLMSTWATDSSQLRLHNVQAYGFYPFPLTEEEEQGYHSDNERIPITAFQKGIEFQYRVVEEFARAK